MNCGPHHSDLPFDKRKAVTPGDQEEVREKVAKVEEEAGSPTDIYNATETCFEWGRLFEETQY